MQGFIECLFYFFPRTRGIVVILVIIVNLPPDCFVFIKIHVGRSVDIRIFNQTLVRDTETALKEEGGKPFIILLKCLIANLFALGLELTVLPELYLK